MYDILWLQRSPEGAEFQKIYKCARTATAIPPNDKDGTHPAIIVLEMSHIDVRRACWKKKYKSWAYRPCRLAKLINGHLSWTCAKRGVGNTSSVGSDAHISRDVSRACLRRVCSMRLVYKCSCRELWMCSKRVRVACSTYMYAVSYLCFTSTRVVSEVYLRFCIYSWMPPTRKDRE